MPRDQKFLEWNILTFYSCPSVSFIYKKTEKSSRKKKVLCSFTSCFYKYTPAPACKFYFRVFLNLIIMWNFDVSHSHMELNISVSSFKYGLTLTSQQGDVKKNVRSRKYWFFKAWKHLPGCWTWWIFFSLCGLLYYLFIVLCEEITEE